MLLHVAKFAMAMEKEKALTAETPFVETERLVSRSLAVPLVALSSMHVDMHFRRVQFAMAMAKVTALHTPLVMAKFSVLYTVAKAHFLTTSLEILLLSDSQ